MTTEVSIGTCPFVLKRYPNNLLARHPSSMYMSQLVLAMQPKIEKELHRQKEFGVIERVDIAEWAALVVPVIKPTSRTS